MAQWKGNKAISKADVILALGTRFGDRSTLMKKERFARQAEIIHVDIDPAEIGKIVNTKIPIVSDIKSFLSDMLAEQKKSAWKHKEPWAIAKNIILGHPKRSKSDILVHKKNTNILETLNLITLEVTDILG